MNENRIEGTRPFYAAALVGMLVSINTSWNFFGDVLHVDNVWDRGSMFFVLEIAQGACYWGMRASIRRHGTPGPARLIAWALCGVAAYMAWSLSGFWVGVARVLLGPLLSLVMLHLGLGIEVRGLKLKETSLWVTVTRELRERFLATLGLSDEGRSARVIIQRRAIARAGRIVMTSRGRRSTRRRFVRELARADVANDPKALTLFVNQMKLATNADRLLELRYRMPFSLDGVTETDTVDEVTPGDTDTTPQVDTDTNADTTPQVDTDTASEKPSTPLRIKSTEAQAQVDTVMELMVSRGGVEAVSVEDVMAFLGLKQATAARRRRVAAEQYDQRVS